eukprot:5081916-Prymnesium_polylepis.2
MQEALRLRQRADDRMLLKVSKAAEAVARRERGDASIWVHAVQRHLRRRRETAATKVVLLQHAREGGERWIVARFRWRQLRVEPDDVLCPQSVRPIIGDVPVFRELTGEREVGESDHVIATTRCHSTGASLKELVQRPAARARQPAPKHG